MSSSGNWLLFFELFSDIGNKCTIEGITISSVIFVKKKKNSHGKFPNQNTFCKEKCYFAGFLYQFQTKTTTWHQKKHVLHKTGTWQIQQRARTGKVLNADLRTKFSQNKTTQSTQNSSGPALILLWRWTDQPKRMTKTQPRAILPYKSCRTHTGFHFKSFSFAKKKATPLASNPFGLSIV